MVTLFLIAYLFFGGAAAGGYIAIHLWEAFFRPAPSHHSDQPSAFLFTQSRLYVVLFILLLFSALCLWFDLGSPDRVFLLFTRPHPTLITLGSFALLVQLIVGFVLILQFTFKVVSLNRKTLIVIKAISGVVSMVIATYTGLFLYACNAPFWHSLALVAVFVFSSLSSGISIIQISSWLSNTAAIMQKFSKPLEVGHCAFLLLEAISIAVFLNNVFSNQYASAAVELLLEPDMFATFLVGAIAMGIALPLAGEIISLARKTSRSLPLISLACLVGGLLLRCCIVACGS